MALTLDHILMGAPGLQAATDGFAELSGVCPAGGGSHPGFGTWNQLLSLDEELFFEIIAPDPAQNEKGRRASGLMDLAVPIMLTFSLRSGDLAGVAAAARVAGLSTLDPVAMGRVRADGVRLAWEILYFDAPEWGSSLPFVIDWKGSPHPAETAPGGCTLLEFTVLHPKAAELRALYGQLGIDVPVRAAMSPGYILRLDTPNGEVILI